MSTPKQTRIGDVAKGVQISKETGGAYIDIREVIESELERIRAERVKSTSNGSIRDSDHHTESNGHQGR